VILTSPIQLFGSEADGRFSFHHLFTTSSKPNHRALKCSSGVARANTVGGYTMQVSSFLSPTIFLSFIKHCSHSPQGQYHTFSFVCVNSESTLLMVSRLSSLVVLQYSRPISKGRIHGLAAPACCPTSIGTTPQERPTIVPVRFPRPQTLFY